MSNIVKAIAKKEGRGDLALFFPEDKVRRGRIAYWSPDSGHGEACILYYHGLRNPTSEEAERIVSHYERGYGVKVKRAYRQSYKQRQEAWS